MVFKLFLESMTSKKLLYVGGLAEEVDEKTLYNAFIPFGDVVDVQLPIDYTVCIMRLELYLLPSPTCEVFRRISTGGLALSSLTIQKMLHQLLTI